MAAPKKREVKDFIPANTLPEPSQPSVGLEPAGNGKTVTSDIFSPNFSTGKSGWRIKSDGGAEFQDVSIVGDITATTGTIGGWHIGATAINDAAGVVGMSSEATGADDIRFWAGDVNPAVAEFRVTEAGNMTAANATVTGSITTGAGSSLDGQYLVATSVNSAAVNLALQGWTFTGVFSATDYRTVAWTAGTFTSSAGTAYAISAGNTGNMAALNYIYLDIAVSTTVLQKTTTATTAIGNGKCLIAVATLNADTTSKASYQVFGGTGGQRLFVDNISANSASTNEFVSNTAQIANLVVTNAKVNDLGVDKLTAGTITGKAITLATSGTGDAKIQAGKTDFDNTVSGFILGIDDSDSDKAKFYIGNTTDYFNFDGTNTVFATSKVDAITVNYGSNILLDQGGSLKFTSVAAPAACVATLITTGVGVVDNGDHKYLITFVNDYGETEMVDESNSVTVDATHKQVQLSDIPTSTSNSVTARKIYRTKIASVSNFYLLTTLAGNITTTYTDNTADADLGTVISNSRHNDSFGRVLVDGEEVFLAGDSNTFVGREAGLSNTVGYNNTAVGTLALTEITEGTENTAVGASALLLNTVGAENTALGFSSLFLNETGSFNTAVGHSALKENESGDNNTALGWGTLRNVKGTGCVGLGYYAGYYETGSNAFYVDNQDRGSTAEDKVHALIYGTMAAATANQFLTVNGNLGVRVGAFGTSADGVLGLANGTVPSTSPADMIQIFSSDIAGGDATLGLRTEVAVAVEVDETKFSHKLPVRINGATYYIMLTQT